MIMLRLLLTQLLAGIMAWLLYAPLIQPLAWTVLASGLALLFGALLLRRPPSLWLAAPWPAVMLASLLQLPAWAYLLGFVLTFGWARNAVRERVPFYRSTRRVADELAELLAPQARLLEAGCADARLALQLLRQRPDLNIEGWESAPLAYALAWLRWQLAGRPIGLKLHFGNFWQRDWHDFDAVYVFLSPAPMPRVWQQFSEQAAPHSLLISNSFTVPERNPDQQITLGGALQQALLIWRHPHGAC